MERNMSNERTTTKDVWKTPSNPPVENEAVAEAVAKKPVKVVSFEIEETDGGGDPYNHTGSFCVPGFEDE